MQIILQYLVGIYNINTKKMDLHITQKSKV